MSINPYRVLQLDEDFTLDELKENYKKLAFANHPDKGGSAELFNIITKSFNKLKKKYKAREDGKRSHMDMKKEFNSHINQETIMAHNELLGNYEPYISVSLFNTPKDNGMNNFASDILQPPQIAGNSKVINRNTGEGRITSQFKGMTKDQFNQLYDKTRLEDATDRGYGNLMMASSKVREDIDIKRKCDYGSSKSFKKRDFNDDFDSQKVSKINKQLIAYKDPETIYNLSSLGCVEIANKNIEDFSGQNDTLKKLNYTDYLVAHSTSKLIDKKQVKHRKEFANIQQLEDDRANISYDLSEEDKLKIKKREEQEARDELKRLKMIKQRDKLVKKQYKSITNMIG